MLKPDLSGNCQEEDKEILRIIATNKYPSAIFDNDTPFVLRGIAPGTNYSDTEIVRLKKAITDLNLSVFERYSLDEANGDRFLMYGFTPSHDTLIRLTQL